MYTLSGIPQSPCQQSQILWPFRQNLETLSSGLSSRTRKDTFRAFSDKLGFVFPSSDGKVREIAIGCTSLLFIMIRQVHVLVGGTGDPYQEIGIILNFQIEKFNFIKQHAYLPANYLFGQFYNGILWQEKTRNNSYLLPLIRILRVLELVCIALYIFLVINLSIHYMCQMAVIASYSEFFFYLTGELLILIRCMSVITFS